MFGMGFDPRADYDLDGKVDSFEEALFFLEMEEEDQMIAGRTSYSAIDDEDDEDDDDDFDIFDDDDGDDF